MSEPIETKPAETNSAEVKPAPCGAKKATLRGAGIGAVLGAVVCLVTNNMTWLPLGIALGVGFSAVLRGGGG